MITYNNTTHNKKNKYFSNTTKKYMILVFMRELVITKTKNNYCLTTKLIKKHSITQLNINHVIKAIKEIEKTTNKLNTLIIAIKTNQLLYLYDPNYLYSNDINIFSENIINSSNMIFDLTDVLHLTYFYKLYHYPLLGLLYIMDIPKIQAFMLINSLCMVNDYMDCTYDSMFFDGSKQFQLEYVQKYVINEILSMNVYLNYLDDNTKNKLYELFL